MDPKFKGLLTLTLRDKVGFGQYLQAKVYYLAAQHQAQQQKELLEGAKEKLSKSILDFHIPMSASTIVGLEQEKIEKLQELKNRYREIEAALQHMEKVLQKGEATIEDGSFYKTGSINELKGGDDSRLSETLAALREKINKEQHIIDNTTQKIAEENKRKNAEIKETEIALANKKKQLDEARRCRFSIVTTLKQQEYAAEKFKGHNVILTQNSQETLLENYFDLSQLLALTPEATLSTKMHFEPPKFHYMYRDVTMQQEDKLGLDSSEKSIGLADSTTYKFVMNEGAKLQNRKAKFEKV
jgi:hypothetical protein